ncbi:hypothetical protein [Micromonospora sp. NPDC050495]|uniref:hypothetical protein n=1 Tax=Micromonospora sp. NPDC050495 TaxID=3154936 RepID=UPI003409B81E
MARTTTIVVPVFRASAVGESKRWERSDTGQTGEENRGNGHSPSHDGPFCSKRWETRILLLFEAKGLYRADEVYCPKG